MSGEADAGAGGKKSTEQATDLSPTTHDSRPTTPSAAAQTILEKLAAVEVALIQPGLHARSGELDGIHFPIKLNNKLEALGFMVARSDDPPTAQARKGFADLARRVDDQLLRLDAVLADDVAAFNRSIRDSGVPAIIVPGD